MKELFLAAFSVVSSLVIFFTLVALGWYIVWALFLSRFRLVRELLGGMNDSSTPTNETRTSRTKTKKTRRD